MSRKILSDSELMQIYQRIKDTRSKKVRSWMICDEVKKQTGEDVSESTIRGRFINMGKPLSELNQDGLKVTSSDSTEESKTERKNVDKLLDHRVPEYMNNGLDKHVPNENLFDSYVKREVDRRLAVHYNIGPVTSRYKYPLTQGKQGTGKTFGHMHYAWKMNLPFFLFSCYEDFQLDKLFGDKTIENGTIKFKESLFVKAVQNPSVILFDEINAVSNANTYDFHALLQNRELFIKDADDGNGKVYRLHPHCRIGFAQNPKSAKYIGGNIKQSNFLGRCTFISYKEFTRKEIKKALRDKFPELDKKDVKLFTEYYFAIVETIERSNLNVDVSIRQLTNVIDFWLHGLPLTVALEDGLISVLDAISQPKAKDSFRKIAEAVWTDVNLK